MLGPMAPYRSAPGPRVAGGPRDAGLVDDIIAQFADKLAFYRELVQNAIDADSPSVHIEVAFDPKLGRAVVSVADRGEGMTRDVIENRLLVLFRSTKEKDDTKIGKFGIGFASVLAMEPQVVRVDTVHDGRRHVLELYPDLSYELFDAGRAHHSGTRVELEVPIPAEMVDGFALSSWEALDKWCRHATVPITFVHRATDGAEVLNERIDRPLALERSLFEITATSSDGQMIAVVGVREGAEPYAGFFNYGLTLYETTDPLLGRLAFKVQDARLGHTLSRDNIRRDRSYDAAMEFVRRLGAEDLPSAYAAEVRDTALAGNRERYVRLLEAMVVARIDVPPESLELPLLEPLGTARTCNVRSLYRGGAWFATERSVLTSHLASRGVPVLDLWTAEDGSGDLDMLLMSSYGQRPRDVHLYRTLATPIAVTETDELLVARVLGLLEHVFRRPNDLVFADLHGAGSSAAVVAGPRAGARGPWMFDADDEKRYPFSLLRRLPVVLNVRSALVARARERATHSVTAAADLLTRAILLSYDKLDVARSTLLLERALDAVVVEAV